MSRDKQLIACLSFIFWAQLSGAQDQSRVLPGAATAALARSLESAKQHERHTWRDTPPWSNDGAVNAYIEISRGDRRKWEFQMAANTRAIDRMMPEGVGGYPVNYGFVPQTISYDGDPFDALVLGPPIPGGTLMVGMIVGLMLMEDETGLDSKVVLSPPDTAGRPKYVLSEAEQRRIGRYFRTYKQHETGTFSRVPGWRTPTDGHAHVALAHMFFRDCREHPGTQCTLER